MDKEALKQYVKDNPKLVSMRPAGPGLYVLKYKKAVFFDDLWNEYLEECRGVVIDEDFNIVSRPFTKIYNYGIEAKAPVLADDTPVLAFRKVNGFMVAATWYNGDVLISTTGSTDSDYVNMAEELIDPAKFAKVCSQCSSYTFMFECVHPNDPHIVVEKPGMYLLGFREKTWDSMVIADNLENLAQGFGCFYPESYETTIGQLMQDVKTVRHEGFVFYTLDGISAKIKSPYYLTSKWVARNPRTDKLVDLKNDIKHNLDEEYYGLIDAIRLNIEAYTAMNEQERLEWVRNFLE